MTATSPIAAIIYRSVARADVDWQTTREIISRSRTRNAERDITGMLLSSGRHFLQMIEGPLQTVNDLYVTIATDPRHRNVQIIDYQADVPRLFPDWTMQGLAIDTLDPSVRSVLERKYGCSEFGILMPGTAFGARSLLWDAHIIGEDCAQLLAEADPDEDTKADRLAVTMPSD